MSTRPPLPPFNEHSAREKVRLARLYSGYPMA